MLKRRGNMGAPERRRLSMRQHEQLTGAAPDERSEQHSQKRVYIKFKYI
jgi:hypothetical protein